MARKPVSKPRKARAEGAKAKKPTSEEIRAVAIQGSAAELVAICDQARDEPPFEEPSDFESKTFYEIEEDEAPRLANPVPGDDGEALLRIFESFKERFPAEWEGLALVPTQHGIVVMGGLLKGKG